MAFAVREATPEDDAMLAAFYRQHWLELGVSEADMAEDWRGEFAAFIAEARQRRGLAGFVLVNAGLAIGSACCHLVERRFPPLLRVEARRIGYVWALFVEPKFRGVGGGATLLNACIGHLQKLGAGRVLLHSGPRSRSLYMRRGFSSTDERGLRLTPQNRLK